VRKAVIADEVGALGAFAYAGAAENVDYGDGFRGEGWGGFMRGGELRVL